MEHMKSSNAEITKLLNAATALKETDHGTARDAVEGLVNDTPFRFIRRVKGWDFAIDVHMFTDLPEGARWMSVFVNITVESDELKAAWDKAILTARDNDFETSKRFDGRRQTLIQSILKSLN